MKDDKLKPKLADRFMLNLCWLSLPSSLSFDAQGEVKRPIRPWGQTPLGHYWLNMEVTGTPDKVLFTNAAATLVTVQHLVPVPDCLK